MDVIDNPSLMDGGANICITGVLSLLVDVVTIPPLLSDDAVYYQPCYYCKNATETIISPKAIIAASDTLVHWTQEGHKGNAPGCIQFMSVSGLYSITLALEKRDVSITV